MQFIPWFLQLNRITMENKMEYEYNCSYFQYNNITPPNVAQQMQGITLVDRNVINLSPRDINSSISMISNLCFFRFPKRWASWPLAWESPVQSVQYFWLFYLSSTFLQISKGVQHEEEGYSVGSLLCPWWSRYYRSSYSSSPELAMFAT